MAEINYYELLGVPEDATPDDIKRSYRRKRGEFSQDEDMLDKLNQAYTVLLDNEQRRNYDNTNKYGKQLTELWKKYNDSESRIEAKEILIQLRAIYKQMESDNKDDVVVLKKLFEIERELGDEKELPYLHAIANIVFNSEKLEDKKEWLRYLGENFVLYEKDDEAIKAYFQIYKMDATDDSICDLIDLLYLKKKNIKASIQVLNDCINRVDDKQLKAKYLSKSYEVVSSLNGENYDKVKKALLMKLQAFKGEEEPLKTIIAIQISLVMGQCLDNEQLFCYDELNRIFESFAIENEDAKLIHKALQEFKKVIANNKYHECIKLLSEDIWTEKMRRKMEVLMLNEIEEIKESLDYFKKFAPTMWNLDKEDNQNIEAIINRLYPLIKEYGKLINNPNISKELKNMIRALAFDGIVRFEKIEAEFAESRDTFFDDNNIEKSRQELRILGRLYPACYQRFSDIFFDGQSIQELLGEETIGQVRKDERTILNNDSRTENKNVYYPDANEEYIHRPYLSGLVELIFIIIGTCCFPPILPIVLITKYYHRHEKAVKRFLKKLLVLGIVALIIAVIGAVVYFVNESKEKQYEEAHNGWLSEDELEKADTLAEEYDNKSDIDIRYIQVEEGDDSQVQYDGPYIYLVYSSMGFSFEYGSHSLYSNCMTDDEREQLADLLFEMVDNEELSDYEVCEKFFELTYDFINENGITYERYYDAVQQQQSYINYELTEDGEYGVGFGSNDILPGEYSVYANVRYDLYLYVRGTVSGYAYPQVKEQTVVGAYKQTIVLEEGDTIELDYWGTGSYSLYMDAKSQQTY